MNWLVNNTPFQFLNPTLPLVRRIAPIWELPELPRNAVNEFVAAFNVSPHLGMFAAS